MARGRPRDRAPRSPVARDAPVASPPAMGRRQWFGGRARTRDVPAEIASAAEAFAQVRDDVERAKAALVTAIRSGRAPGAPLAEALAGFEHHLAEADATMDRWHVDAVRTQWLACRDGLDQA